MSWGFFWGLVIGTCLGFLVSGLLSVDRDNKEYIELNHYEENEKKNEVEE